MIPPLVTVFVLVTCARAEEAAKTDRRLKTKAPKTEDLSTVLAPSHLPRKNANEEKEHKIEIIFIKLSYL